MAGVTFYKGGSGDVRERSYSTIPNQPTKVDGPLVESPGAQPKSNAFNGSTKESWTMTSDPEKGSPMSGPTDK